MTICKSSVIILIIIICSIPTYQLRCRSKFHITSLNCGPLHASWLTSQEQIFQTIKYLFSPINHNFCDKAQFLIFTHHFPQLVIRYPFKLCPESSEFKDCFKERCCKLYFPLFLLPILLHTTYFQTYSSFCNHSNT